MGCFSWLCDECGKGIKSTSFSGEECILFLLKSGKVIQKMEGQYDSYGRVFIEGTRDMEVAKMHDIPLKKSQMWKDPFPNRPPSKRELDLTKGKGIDVWSRVCELLFHTNKSNGIAAVHKKCFKGKMPTKRSESDPNQGWGEDDELLGDCDPDKKFD